MRTVQLLFCVGILLVSFLAPTQVRGQVNVSGKAGLLYIPTAEETPDGTFAIGYTLNPSNYAFRYNRKNWESIFFVNLVLLPRLEVNLNLLRPNGPVKINGQNYPPGFAEEGIGDRQIDIRYVVLTEKPKRPSVALVLSMPFGIDNSLITNAMVATKHIPVTRSITAAITVGMGSPYSLYRSEVKNEQDSDIFSGFSLKDKRDNPYHYLTGPFGGIKLTMANKAGFMAEWDSQHLNVGAYATLFKRWTIQAGLLNADQITVGTSYAVPLLRQPKRTASKS